MPGFKDIRKDDLIFTDTSQLPLPGGIVPCLLCTKPFLMGVFVGAPDQICEECRKTYAECAKVICNGLGEKRPHPPITICRVRPMRLDNGFTIQPRAILHSNACNTCKPGLEESTILEIDHWQKYCRSGKIIVPQKK